MGEGLFSREGAVTAYAEPYEDLNPEDNDQEDYDQVFEAFEGRVCEAAGRTFNYVGDQWGRDGDRVILRNGLFELTFYEDSYSRLHVSFAVSKHVDGTPQENLATGRLSPCAEAFFDRLQESHELRVRTGGTTSAPRHRKS